MSTTAKQAKIGAGIFLEGEKEFKQAITGINKGLEVNKSELSLVDAEYAKNSDSAEALTSKIKVLKDQIELKTKKVQTMEAALAGARKEFGDNDAKVLTWQKSLNLAKADLVKTTNALDETQEALQKTGKETTSLADGLTDLASMAGINVPPALQKGIDKLDGVSVSGAALVGVIAGVASELANLTIKTSQTADNLLTMSSTTGLSTDALQEFNYASELVDVSIDTMSGSMTKMIKSMSSAKDETGSAAEAYKKLHIRVKDSKGELRDAEKVYYEAIDALGKVSNETERDALAMEIFGKSARELNPLIEAGSDRLRELGDEAHEVGYVMDEETLSAFGQLDDAMQKMNNQGEALKNSFATALLPMLTSLFEAISAIPVPVLQTVIVLAGVVATIILAVKAIKEMTSTASAISGFFKGIDPVALKTTAIILGVVAALVALAAIIAVLAGKSNEIQQTMASVTNSTSKLTSAASVQTGRVPQYAKGTDYHPGGLAIVGESGPELVSLPRGSKVLSNRESTVRAKGGNTYIMNVQSRDMQNVAQLTATFERMHQRERAK